MHINIHQSDHQKGPTGRPKAVKSPSWEKDPEKEETQLCASLNKAVEPLKQTQHREINQSAIENKSESREKGKNKK